MIRDDVVIDKIGPLVYVVKRRLLTNGRSVSFDDVVCAWSLSLLSANCPNLKILNIKFGYKLYDDIQDLRNSLPDILRINSLEKLSFFHLRTEDDSFGIDYKENDTIKELKFEESALSGETLIHIATKSLHLEKLYVEGQTRDVYDWFLNIEFNEMVEILNILSVYGTIKDLQILNCVYDNIDDTIEDIENFFRSNLVPLIQAKFSNDCYIKIIYLQPDHTNLEDPEAGDLLVMLEKKVNRLEPQVTLHPYPSSVLY